DCRGVGLVAWIFASAWLVAWMDAVVAAACGGRVYLFLYRGPGGAFLSGVVAEFAGAAGGAAWGADSDGGAFWLVALQQAGAALQLAICFAGGDCRDF